MDRVLDLIKNKDQGIQKSALSNFQKLLLHPESLPILEGKLPKITEVIKLKYNVVNIFRLSWRFSRA